MFPDMAAPIMRWDVINALGQALGRPWRYLEIGCQHGHTARRVGADHKQGVDPKPLGGCRRYYTSFFTGTSDEFFDLYHEKWSQFDVIFIDGLHEAGQVLQDVDNSLAMLAPGGTIVLHDCNPKEEIHQIVPRQSGVWNGDVWKALVLLRRRPGLKVYTLDTDEGLGIVQRHAGAAPALAIVQEDLTWAALQANRAQLLGLRSVEGWAP